MADQEPQQIQRQFEEAFNAKDIDRLLALFEPDVAYVPEPGKVVYGLDEVRKGLEGLLALGGTFRITTRYAVRTGDIALTAGSWTLEGTGPDGQALNLAGETAEVLKRQPDGSWRYLIDNPLAG